MAQAKAGSQKRKSSQGQARKTTGGNTTKKKTAKKTSTKGASQRKNKKASNSSSDFGADLMLLLFFACIAIMVLSNFNLAGSVGVWIKGITFGLFGIIQYVLPFILLGVVIYGIASGQSASVKKIKGTSVILLSLLLSALFLRINNNPEIEYNSLGSIYEYSEENFSGRGLIGGIICKCLSPIGTVGSIIVLLLLIILMFIIISEKSLKNGVAGFGRRGSRMVHAARQDYEVYKEYSSSRERRHEDDFDEEEYLARRKEQQLERLQKREERKLSRLDKKAKGVTLDTKLDTKKKNEPDYVDVHEIFVDAEREDEYSKDIYTPDDTSIEMETVITEETDDNGIFSDKEIPLDDSVHLLSEQLEKKLGRTLNEMMEKEKSFDVREILSENTLVEDEVMEEEEKYIQLNDESEISYSDGEDDIYNEEELEEEVVNEISPAKNASQENNPKPYIFPSTKLLENNSNDSGDSEADKKKTAIKLAQTLQNFGVKVTITDISCGPAVTRYELSPEQGVKVSKIVSLADDIKLNLAAADIRIEAPIPGKAAIGIEVPNKTAGSVGIRELIESEEFNRSKSSITFVVGKDIAGKTIIADIEKMPHLLIAGATGSGKSVCINTIIMSIIYKSDPKDVKMIMIDPKMVELRVYDGIPHLMIPVVIDPKKAAGALNWAVNEMTDRYKRFSEIGVRNLKGYNEKLEAMRKNGEENVPEKMPQIVIIVDELADLMMVAPGEVEDAICRLAQLARAAGIHLVIATQRPSVNVITGLIKANVPSRIAFAVSSGVDSRTIIDMNGAEKLLGKGDMLFFPSGYPKPLRVQGAFVTDDEVARVVDFLKSNTEDTQYNQQMAEAITSTESNAVKIRQNSTDERDSLFEEAGRMVIEKEKGSIGMLQRYFKIGFNRAARIMDQLAEAGVVGPEIGTKARKINMTQAEFEELLNKNR